MLSPDQAPPPSTPSRCSRGRHHDDRLRGGHGGGGGGGGGLRSPLDDDDHAFACKYGSLEEVAGRVAEVAQDQNGCRFLQKKFDEGGPAAIAAVFGEVLERLVELMSDPFGNYLIQKLLDRCSEEQRLQVGRALPTYLPT